MTVLRCFGFAALLAAIGCSDAKPPFDAMKSQTVLILVPVKTRDGKVAGSSGSGFVIADGQHVVTNFHVCCQPVQNEAGRAVVIRLSKDELVSAKVVWSSKEKDLAVLKAEKDLGRPRAVLAGSDYSDSGDSVFAIGFPGAAQALSDDEFQTDPAITDGVISKKTVSRKLGGNLAAGVRVYVSDVSVNPGNSGGPLFDACGRVVGVVTGGVTTASGVNYMIRIDEVLEALPGLSLKADQAGGPCSLSGGVSSWFAVGLIGGIVLASLSLTVAFNARGRALVRNVTRRRWGAAKRLRPVLRGVAGSCAGTEVELADQSWSLGRDPRAADLALPGDAQAVSRRHCLIRYHHDRGVFLLEDAWSTNGTFLASGERVPGGETRQLRPGDRFYLGTPELLFEVGLEEGEGA